MQVTRRIKIAAAQSKSVPGDIRANVDRHLAFAEVAASRGATFLLFPELSLVGYELGRLAECVVHPDDGLVAPLRDCARSTGMTIVFGAPVAAGTDCRPAIGAICCHSDGSNSVYRKRFLHQGEESYASAGMEDVYSFDAMGERVSLAICADTTHPEHARWARQAGAAIYAAGVLWSRTSYDRDAAMVARCAGANGLAVLVANHAAPSGGFDAAGKSGFWLPDGQLLHVVPNDGEALLVAEVQGRDWLCRSLPVYPER